MTAANRFPMPFLLELDAAADIIDARIAARDKLVRFPRTLSALLTVSRAAPTRLTSFVMSKVLRAS